MDIQKVYLEAAEARKILILSKKDQLKMEREDNDNKNSK